MYLTCCRSLLLGVFVVFLFGCTMGRNRGKAKKQTIIAAHEDHGSGEEEKMPAKRRGRPLKISKSETKDKEEAENFDDGENMNGVLSENTNTQSGAESGRKRGRASEINGNNGTVEDESGVDIKINANDSVKPVGFRQNGSRRKNKPQRAAEVGVECR